MSGPGGTELFADRYRRLGSLGRGAMGEVWLADDIVLGRRVAIKQLRVDASAGADRVAVERMAREARVAARLDHPNIVGVHDLLTIDGQPYVVMQFVDGESLAERIRRLGPLSPGEVAAIFGPLARGLETAHRAGVVHRDIKPANVLIAGDGTAKLADFGIARQHGDAELTDTGQIIGTLAYMSPDIARGAVASPATDMWSFGAAMYAATEGRAPYGTTGQQSTAGMLVRLVTEPVSPPARAGELTPLLARLLDPDPRLRPTAGEVARALTGIAAGPAPTAARTAPTADRAAPTSQATQARSYPAPPTVTIPAPGPGAPASHRRRAAVVALAAFVLVLIVGAAVWVVTRQSSDSPAAAPQTLPRRSSGTPASSPPTTQTSPTVAASSRTPASTAPRTAAGVAGFAYVDPQSGYRFSVGPGLANHAAGDTGSPDVQIWQSPSGSAQLEVGWTTPTARTSAARVVQCRAVVVRDGGNLTYSVHDGDKFICSGFTDASRSTIYYTTGFVGAHREYYLTWSYPASENLRWNSDVERTAATFRPGRDR